MIATAKGQRESVILDSNGQPIRLPRRVSASVVNSQDYIQRFRNRLNARYEAAETNDENENHWSMADGYSASRANRYSIRKRLRERARYERDNNSYLQGMCQTLANDTVGEGARLQVLTDNPQANKKLEAAFNSWAEEVCLAEKLRTLRITKAIDGEPFAQLITNNNLFHPVKLDLLEIEADLIHDMMSIETEQQVDGIKIDRNGNPTQYYRLREHPGGFMGGEVKGDWLDAKDMIHMFRRDRPGQYRGIPEITSALSLFASHRRFRFATVAAAETAAEFSAIMRTNAQVPDGPDELEGDALFASIPIEYRMMMTLPHGWDITQLRAEHPTTTYEMFDRRLLAEIARCLLIPVNLASGDSSAHNFSSARLDILMYRKAIDVERSYIESRCLRKLFYRWFEEAIYTNTLPPGLPPLYEIPIKWFWRSPLPVIDESKHANAIATALSSGQKIPSQVHQENGDDWEEIVLRGAQDYGVTVEEFKNRFFVGMNPNGQVVDDASEDESQESSKQAAKNSTGDA